MSIFDRVYLKMVESFGPFSRLATQISLAWNKFHSFHFISFISPELQKKFERNLSSYVRSCEKKKHETRIKLKLER